MIRFFAFFLLASGLNFSFGEEMLPFKPYFEVLSVKKDPKVSRSKCLIEGQFYDYRTGEKIGDMAVERGGDQILLTDGSFAILMKLKEPSLKVHKLEYNDLVFDRFELKGGCRMKLKFYMEKEYDGEEIRFEVKKPVIYAYSSKDLVFELGIKAAGKLDFVYPALDPNGKWVMALRNKQLFRSGADVSYPYLFWEASQAAVHYKINADKSYAGDLVARRDLAAYMDSCLQLIGFTPTEKTDFITFWLPPMLKHEYCFVQFLLDEECDQFATYDIAPKPDRLNRVYMLYSGFAYRPSIPAVSQSLPKMKREGFYLVDWGGVELPFEENLNAKYEHTKE